MENKIYTISESEISNIIKKLQRDPSIFVAELDGASVSTLQDYFKRIDELFRFPVPTSFWAGYLDWIRDLSWLKKDRYVLVIHHFKSFLQDDPISKKKVITRFKETILPFWEEEVEHVVVGGKAKPFQVYLVD